MPWLKLKLSLLSHSVVLLIEHFERYARFYYSDGHYEIQTDHLKEYIYRKKGISGYKNPIQIQNVLLFPTVNQKYQECQWLNLDYLEEKDAVYTELLTEKNLLLKCRTMYLRNKEKRFLEGI